MEPTTRTHRKMLPLLLEVQKERGPGLPEGGRRDDGKGRVPRFPVLAL